jgi:hypothetical protein
VAYLLATSCVANTCKMPQNEPEFERYLWAVAWHHAIWNASKRRHSASNPVDRPCGVHGTHSLISFLGLKLPGLSYFIKLQTPQELIVLQRSTTRIDSLAVAGAPCRSWGRTVFRGCAKKLDRHKLRTPSMGMKQERVRKRNQHG